MLGCRETRAGGLEGVRLYPPCKTPIIVGTDFVQYSDDDSHCFEKAGNIYNAIHPLSTNLSSVCAIFILIQFDLESHVGVVLGVMGVNKSGVLLSRHETVDKIIFTANVVFM